MSWTSPLTNPPDYPNVTGQGTGTLQFNVVEGDMDAEGLHYICAYHPSMAGPIAIMTGTITFLFSINDHEAPY